MKELITANGRIGFDNDDIYINGRLVKGGSGSGGSREGAGRPAGSGGGEGSNSGSESKSDVYSKNSASVKSISGTAEEKVKMQEALKYIDKKDLSEDVILSSSDLKNKYGNSSGNKVYVDKAAIADEHPIFVAAIVYHEGVHLQQNQKWPAEKKEFNARYKTKIWASMKYNKASKAEKISLDKVIKESSTR